jgi:regulator of cell morphogenesis and NO signaling
LLRAAFDEVADQIAAHLAKEEHLLFPAIAALSSAERQDGRRPALAFATVLHPIRFMEAEHGRIEMAVARLRELARAVPEPDTLSDHWHRCMADLAKLDAELRQHHRTENEVLFPRALDLERRLL